MATWNTTEVKLPQYMVTCVFLHLITSFISLYLLYQSVSYLCPTNGGLLQDLILFWRHIVYNHDTSGHFLWTMRIQLHNVVQFEHPTNIVIIEKFLIDNRTCVCVSYIYNGRIKKTKVTEVTNNSKIFFKKIFSIIY